MPVLGHELDAKTFALWRFDEATSGVQLHDEVGALPLAAVANPAPTGGQIDGARSFNGTTQYFKAATPPGDLLTLFRTGSWTFESWVKLSSSWSTERMLAICCGDVPFDNGLPDMVLMEIGVTGGRQLYWLQWTNDTNWNQGAMPDQLSTNVWHHVAVSRLSEGAGLYTLSIYVDGIRVAQSSGVPAGDSEDPGSGVNDRFFLGFTPDGGGLAPGDEYFPGTIDDTRLSRGARTDDEILSSYLRGRNVQEAESPTEATPYEIYQPAIAPSWAQTTKARRLLATSGAHKDQLARRVRESVKARMPGFAPPDALAALGSERNLDKYPGDSDSTFAQHIQAAWDIWQYAGTPKGVLDELFRAFQPYTNWRLVTQRGRSWQRDADGTFSFVEIGALAFQPPNFWNTVQLWWYPPLPWGPPPSDGSIEAETTRTILSKWKGGHVKVDRIVLLDSTSQVWGQELQTWGQASLNWGAGATPAVYWTPPT